MRNPKFRIWNKQTKAWQEYGFHLIGEIMLLQGFPIEDLNNLEINEFTGLQDSTGRDIYEGDIVSDPKLITAEVKFLNASFVVKNRFSPHWVVGQKRAAQMAVIGNIYEHNSLLP